MHAYLESCQRHGIYVWLQIFGEPFIEEGPDRWFINPFNAGNNVNALPGLPGGAGSGEEAFYDPDNAALMRVQDALVRRLLDETAARYGNVVYEIGNEVNADSVTSKAAAWQQHWIDFFRAYETQHGVVLLLSNNTRRSLFDAAAAGFQVVNHQHFGPFRVKDNPPAKLAQEIFAAVTQDFERYNRPIVNSRPCSDPDRTNYWDIVSEAEGRCLYWSYFLSGGHVIGFRTTEESWKGGLKAERIIKHLRTFIDRMPLEDMTPRHRLVNGHALCLAAPDQAYALYLPAGGAVTVDLSAAQGTLAAQWYDPRTGLWRAAHTIQPRDGAPFTAPDDDDWGLHISRED